MDVINQLLAFRAQLEIFVDILSKSGLLSDEAATSIPLLFKIWKPGTQQNPADYPADGTIWRCPFDGNLYRVKEGMGHKSYGDENYAPSRYHAGWEPVANPGEDGSREHPYTWVSGMKGESGKYYREEELLCRCKQDVPAGYLWGPLSSFVGSYMEVAT